MKVTKSPDDSAARTNRVFVSALDLPATTKYVIIENQYVFNCMVDKQIPVGSIGTTLFHRRFASLSLSQDVSVKSFDPLREGTPFCATITLVASFLKKNVSTEEYYDTDEMGKIFKSLFNEQIFSIDQSLYFDFKGQDILVQVSGIEAVEIEGVKGGKPAASSAPLGKLGMLMSTTSIIFTKAADSSIRLKGASGGAVSNAIIKPDFNFANLGIGGLDDEFANIFRRAFVSRIFPPAIVERMGIQHVKGILLYGPPGTGKTLMARQIGKMLNCNEPLIVNGPEILNKFVGQSEENVRKLFAPAEAEYKAKREESSLHIIIFDELDAICKQRGSKNDGTGVGDSIVNQLLSKMDGVDQLNNILIIGMTNRLDMIDEALLRPGRLEIHMEINLPDENGRVQILNVHTTKMRQYNLLEADVDLREIASLTKNFSGAEIAGLIKSASSFAFNRHVKIGDQASVAQDFDKIKVARVDFIRALDEVHPAFGVSEQELAQCVPNGIIKHDPRIEEILTNGTLYVGQVKNSTRTPLVSVLLHGPPGSGKTALAATIAISSEAPFIKLISPESMVGFTEQAKMNQINKVFNDAYKSPFSVVVIDSIERLLDWVSIGPRFSNSVLQTLLVLMKKLPPKNHKLLVLATTNQRSVLEQMELLDSFNSSLFIPNVTTLYSIENVLSALGSFDESSRKRVISELDRAGISKRISVGVKKLIYMIEMASQDEEKVEKLVNTIQEDGLSPSYQ